MPSTLHPTDPSGDILALHGGTVHMYGQRGHNRGIKCDCGQWFPDSIDTPAESRWERHVKAERERGDRYQPADILWIIQDARDPNMTTVKFADGWAYFSDAGNN